MPKPLIIVTGKNGQLGWELQQLAGGYTDAFEFLFTGQEELDLGNPSGIPAFFEQHPPQYFINCAAYTAVDKAETEQEKAYAINAEAAGSIAQQCHQYNATLVNISTDYVFDGKGTAPYKTDTQTDPVNYYGYTKWLGEKLTMENNAHTIIIRTSWLYSRHGNNFVKTMLRLMNERPELKVVNDQVGSPTYAADFADTIMQLITSLAKGNTHYGIYHYSNTGVISWYDFAVAIRDLAGLSCNVLPIPTTDYPTPAKRPAYSAMDLGKITDDFQIQPNDWKESLGRCMAGLL